MSDQDTEEAPHPNCFGLLYDKTVEDCKKCKVAVPCRFKFAKKNITAPRTREVPTGLRRRIRYFCFRCSPEREDCVAPDCPFYDLRKYNAGTPEPLWKLPSREWERAGTDAVQRRLAAFEANLKK